MPVRFNKDELVGKWIHSHEEDTADLVVYRNADYPFPPSRGRRAITLEKEGVAIAEYPGPDDRQARSTGTWTLHGDILTISTPGWSHTFKLVEISPDFVTFHKE